MIILEESTANQTIRFTPRTLVTDTISNVSFTFTDTLSKTVETVTGSMAPDKSYASASLALPFLKEDRSYELVVYTVTGNVGINGSARRTFNNVIYQAYGFDGLNSLESFNRLNISIPDSLIVSTASNTISGSNIASFIVGETVLENLRTTDISTSGILPGGNIASFGLTEAQVDALTPQGFDISGFDSATSNLTFFTEDQVLFFPGESTIPVEEQYRSLIEVTNQTVAEYSSNEGDYTQYDGPSVNQYTVYQE